MTNKREEIAEKIIQIVGDLLVDRSSTRQQLTDAIDKVLDIYFPLSPGLQQISGAHDIEDWTAPDKNGNINVPDYLDKLVNSIAFQFRFVALSGKNEIEAVCDTAYIAQKFFTQLYTPAIALSYTAESLRQEFFNNRGKTWEASQGKLAYIYWLEEKLVAVSSTPDTGKMAEGADNHPLYIALSEILKLFSEYHPAKTIAIQAMGKFKYPNLTGLVTTDKND